MSERGETFCVRCGEPKSYHRAGLGVGYCPDGGGLYERPRDVVEGREETPEEMIAGVRDVLQHNTAAIGRLVEFAGLRPSDSRVYRKTVSALTKLERLEGIIRGGAEDGARIDWLERRCAKLRRLEPGQKVMIVRMGGGDTLPGQPTVREAIDTAMEGDDGPR